MKAALCLEYVGESGDAQIALYSGKLDGIAPGLGGAAFGCKNPRKPWVAEIIGYHGKYGFERTFLSSKRNYSRANSSGSRGVELWFVLESGKVYEVKAPQSWRSVDRYFCRVDDDGDIIRMSKDEVGAWLRKAWESASSKRRGEE